MTPSLLNRVARLLGTGRSPQHLTLEDFRQMRITGTVEYVAGAATLTVVTFLPDPDTSDHGPLLVLALIGLLLAALRFTAPQRLETVRASILVGFVYIASIVAVAHPLGPTPFFFLWPMLTSAYFLGRRDLAAFTLVFAAALAAGLLGNGTDSVTAVMLPPTFTVTLIVSILVLALRERVDGLIADLKHTASTDTLTGLPNRRTFEETCDAAVAHAHRHKTPVAVAIFDLDHFKAINDRLGHAAGDEALRRFAGVLRDVAPADSCAARIGGEEFAVVLPSGDAESARQLAEHVLHAVLTRTKHDLAPLSVSVGVTALGGPQDTRDVLLLAADRALYEAKNTGRARVVVASAIGAARAAHTGHQLELRQSASLPPAA